MGWINLARFLRRDLINRTKRGPTQEEAQAAKRWAEEAKLENRRKQAAVEGAV